MSTFIVNVKWNREMYKDVECNTEQSPKSFKTKLSDLTGVLPARQKVLAKGKTLGDNWDGFPLTNGATLLMMGSKEESIPTGPSEPTKFIEDMNDADLALAMKLPPGLKNLGDTCFMNATIQCLKTVPPLTKALQIFREDIDVAPDIATSLTAALRDVYLKMDSGVTVSPVALLKALRSIAPQFAETDEDISVIEQQDPNECWKEFLRAFKVKLPPESGSKHPSVIDQYMGGSFEVEMKCDDAPEEPVSITTKDFLQLNCLIEHGTKFLVPGLIAKLTKKVTKISPTLNRDAVYTKISKISRLPGYLTVKLMRFAQKKVRGLQPHTTGCNNKLLREVKFPMNLDVRELCTKALQDRLQPMRDEFKDCDWKERRKREATFDGASEINTPCHFTDDSGSNNSGFYELQAVISHKGRYAVVGRYIAWVKYNDDVWLKCDDDKVSTVTSEDILKLSGGGDWHMAYILLYGPQRLEIHPDQVCKRPRLDT